MSNQRLQNRFKVPWRQTMAVCERLGSDWPSTRVKRDVNDGRDRQDAFTRQKLHVSGSTTAIWKKRCSRGTPSNQTSASRRVRSPRRLSPYSQNPRHPEL
jgi:hypothetical protein